MDVTLTVERGARYDGVDDLEMELCLVRLGHRVVGLCSTDLSPRQDCGGREIDSSRDACSTLSVGGV